jgi:hypothetical protein
MRAVLSAEIPVERFAVFAEMAWLKRRPELGLLCRAAIKQGDRVSVATVQAALPGLRDAGAGNVILWCQMLGLCDGNGGLTELGKDVAQSDEAPVPEQGVYDVWFAAHPLLGRRILSIDRLTSTRDHRFDAIRPLNTEPDRGVVFRSVVNPDERFMLRDLPSNHGKSGCLEGSTRATCQLRWTLDFDGEQDQWSLNGVIEGPGGMTPLQHQQESDNIDLWRLASIWGTNQLGSIGQWSADERRLAISFQGLSDQEQDTFCKTVKLRYVEVPGKGGYDNVTLSDVPIGPTSPQEAQHWAMSRLTRRLATSPRYRSRSEVRHLFAELTEDTPLEHFGPTLPSHDTLIAGNLHTKQHEVFWGLAAPVDLAPYPVPTQELDELAIGTPAVDVTPASSSVIRIPYRGGWSMRQLVDRLLHGASPRRVLLCDRYVRGADNLATLRLLVDAVRAVDDTVEFEVWTGDQKSDFKQIRDITGSQPRTYRQVFGQSPPHDRYLLVLPRTGDAFGWHLSNSPLHVCVDVFEAGFSTQFRWKDLAGTKVSADELEPALRQWLSGGAR